MTTIDMQTMRYINLLDKISHVKTRKCFVHNNTIFFAVKRTDVSKAIGPNADNIKKLKEKIDSKVKIIAEANSTEDIKKFIGDIISPTKAKSIEIKEKEIVITAGNNQNKASLIGRNKRRFEELQKIIRDYFDLYLKII